MEFDPHTLHVILQRIEQQMRCPQCGKKVPVDFASLKLAAKEFVLLQLKCVSCNAYIVLHASLKGAEELDHNLDVSQNASSTMSLKEDELEVLRAAIQQKQGSFTSLFEPKDAKKDQE